MTRPELIRRDVDRMVLRRILPFYHSEKEGLDSADSLL